MKRVAIYARYSSDMQKDASIEDQIRLYEERAEREGWTIVGKYPDHGVSGASLIRPGIQMLMQDAQAGKFDIVLSEALDRLSRDQEDIAGIKKRLTFANVMIFTLSEGEISELHIGLKGTMNALFLKDLADKTRRGLRGRIEKGKSGGGNTFGYNVVNKLLENGEVERGDREINQLQAQVVVRIFNEYIKGKSPRMIAMDLNKEDVISPTGKKWGPSTIYGNRTRGSGILNNELYIGRLIWNRLRYLKDPETGKRVSRLNPEDEWVITAVPDLRIIEQDLWDAAKKTQGVYKKQERHAVGVSRPKNLFSHMLKCGECGGGYSMISGSHLGCSTSRNKGTCDNRLAIKRENLERDVLTSLQTHLMNEDLCKEFCQEYTKHMNKLRIEHNSSLTGYKAELAKLEREKEKIIDTLLNGVSDNFLIERANKVQERLELLKNIIENTDEAPVLFHPSMANRYHKEVQKLIQSLQDPEHRLEGAILVRSLIDKIVITPTNDPEKRLTVDLYGDLAGILSIATNKDKQEITRELSKATPKAQETWITGDRFAKYVDPDSRQDTMVAGVQPALHLSADSSSKTSKQDTLVAGVGFEPTTFRL